MVISKVNQFLQLPQLIRAKLLSAGVGMLAKSVIMARYVERVDDHLAWCE